MEAGGGGKLKLYADFNSPFARAVILFCRCAPENQSVNRCHRNVMVKRIEPMCNSQFGMYVGDGFAFGAEQSILGLSGVVGGSPQML